MLSLRIANTTCDMHPCAQGQRSVGTHGALEKTSYAVICCLCHNWKTSYVVICFLCHNWESSYFVFCYFFYVMSGYDTDNRLRLNWFHRASLCPRCGNVIHDETSYVVICYVIYVMTGYDTDNRLRRNWFSRVCNASLRSCGFVHKGYTDDITDDITGFIECV